MSPISDLRSGAKRPPTTQRRENRVDHPTHKTDDVSHINDPIFMVMQSCQLHDQSQFLKLHPLRPPAGVIYTRYTHTLDEYFCSPRPASRNKKIMKFSSTFHKTKHFIISPTPPIFPAHVLLRENFSDEFEICPGLC